MRDMPVGKYQELVAWQIAMELVLAVYELSARLPQHEIYALASQLRRAAVSIPANIAEGHARRSKKEYLQFVSVALGSLAELETELTITLSVGYATNETLQECFKQTQAVGRHLRGLERWLAVATQSRKC
ncbi:MAG TPA: four helix bundle protein [Casimicrobiaceae bacterium]|nr:four helix bundle protein [Casimicrobiaceae bacterium]